MAQRRNTRRPPRKRAPRHRTSHAARNGPPRTREAYDRMSDRARHDYTQALNVVAKMRGDRLSLRQASRLLGADARKVSGLARQALRKDKRGRWTPTKRDRLLRVLTVPGARGPRDVAVRDSRAASQIAAYADAIRKYIRTGDASAVKPFRTLRLVDAHGKPISLLTNLRALDRLGHAGLLSFESLYAGTAK